MIAALEKLSSRFDISSTTLYLSILSSLVVLALTYINVSRYNFWNRQGIKGPLPFPFLGNTLDLFLSPLLTRLDDRWKQYGPVHGMYRKLKPQLVIGDTDMLKDVLVRDWHVFADRRGDSRDGNAITDNFLTSISGNHWKRLRSVMSPTFTSGKMKSMFTIIDDCCKLMAGNIQKKIIEERGKMSKNQAIANGGTVSKNQSLEINFRHLAGCYSMDVIAKCCFATETNSFDDPNQVFVTFARKFFHVPKFRRFLAFVYPNWIKRMVGFTANSKDSLNFLSHVARTLLEKRTKKGHSSGHQLTGSSKDYLQLLIEASKGQMTKENDFLDNESHHGYEEMNGKVNESLAKESEISGLKKPISTDEIISNSVLFLAVGYDTTSNLITMTCYSLACDQVVQETLYEELKRTYEDHGGKFDYETISGLKYLDAVISEALRILPPAPAIERRCLEDYTFKSNGIFIPKGSIVTLPIWNMHHDQRFWPEPEKFDPSRFMPENRSKIVPYSYIPFGGGPRNCIGMRFALLEAKLAVAHLILNFKFSPSANTDIPLDLSPTTSLLTPKRVFLGVEERV